MSMKLLTRATMASALLAGHIQADSLLDAINQTLATNPEILISTSEVDARTEAITQARSGYLPSVDLTAGIGYENSRNSTTTGAYNARHDDDPSTAGSKDQDRTRRDASLILRQMLFDGFAVSSEVDRQEARQTSAAEEVCSVANTTALEVAEAYIGVIRQRAVFELMKSNTAEHERVVDLIQKQGRKGRSNEADVSQAESRMVLAKANEISAESILRDVKTQYQRLVGNLPTRYDQPQTPAGSPTTLDEALQIAVENHPVLGLAGADINAAEAQYESSKSNFMPQFELEVGANWDTDANGGKDDTYSHVAKVNMTYNLYSGGADKARMNETSVLMNKALEIRNRAQRQVEEEVRLAWVAVEYGAKRLSPLAEHVKQSGKSRALYDKQFMIGNRTLLDLLDSQNEYTTARQSELNARYEHLFNQYRLLSSTGTLLTSLDARLPVANICGLQVGHSEL